VGTSTASRTLNHEQALKSLDGLPPFSPILNRLLATLADEDVAFSKVATLIEKDTVLAGNVLRVVNSALYGCRGTINSVGHAIAIMGITKLRNTALGFSVARMWRNVRCARGWSMANFNLHSIGTAILSDMLAQRADVHYAEGAFVCGLFHDLGKLLMAVSMPVEYDSVLRREMITGTDLEAFEREVLGITHADLSALALERWNLPRPIQLGVAFHHDPASAPPDAWDDYGLCLAQVVGAADEVVNALGISVVRAGEELPAAPESSLVTALGLGDRFDVIVRDFQHEYDVVKSLF
jgi:HD-like signal output (HDOD) protein